MRLLTFRLSHYCEKVRWALERLRLPYVEESYLPVLHWLKTIPLGGSSVPVLVTETEVSKDSADILRYLDEIAPPHLKLYPTSLALRDEIDILEAKFDRELGRSTRQWIYSYWFHNRNLMKQLWCDRVPAWEQSLFFLQFPLARGLARRGYRIDDESTMIAYQQIQRVFETVSHRLFDGRSYLVGDCFSVADLTFASLAALAVFPAEYGGILPDLSQLPSEMQECIQDLRETVAGKYALRLYREERHVKGVEQ